MLTLLPRAVCLLLALVVLFRPMPQLRESDATLPAACAALHSKFAPRGAASRNWAERSALYARIMRDFSDVGVTGVSGAGGTQGMAVDSLFAWDDATGLPSPRLRRLSVPVRAIVLPIPRAADADALMGSASATLLPLLSPSGVWLQDPQAMHASIFHASHHLQEVPASAAEVEAEARAVGALLNATCPLRVVLERVVITTGGVVMACWQVAAGGQPAELRAALRAALPRAPARQLLTDSHILHSTLARILRLPPGGAAALEPVAAALSQALCGLEVVFDTAWFVEEHDALALALRGLYKARAMQLACGPPATGGRLLDLA